MRRKTGRFLGRTTTSRTAAVGDVLIDTHSNRSYHTARSEQADRFFELYSAFAAKFGEDGLVRLKRAFPTQQCLTDEVVNGIKFGDQSVLRRKVTNKPLTPFINLLDYLVKLDNKELMPLLNSLTVSIWPSEITHSKTRPITIIDALSSGKLPELLEALQEAKAQEVAILETKKTKRETRTREIEARNAPLQEFLDIVRGRKGFQHFLSLLPQKPNSFVRKLRVSSELFTLVASSEHGPLLANLCYMADAIRDTHYKLASELAIAHTRTSIRINILKLLNAHFVGNLSEEELRLQLIGKYRIAGIEITAKNAVLRYEDGTIDKIQKDSVESVLNSLHLNSVCLEVKMGIIVKNTVTSFEAELADSL